MDNSTHTFHVPVEGLRKLASEALGKFGHRKVWLFEGSLGAGKTTFIKELCKALDVEDNVSSPTYSIVNQYQSPKGKEVYHFDCYRLEDEEEAFDVGAEEYFYSGCFCFVEWPSKIEGLWPDSYVAVSVEFAEGEGLRTFKFRIVESDGQD